MAVPAFPGVKRTRHTNECVHQPGLVWEGVMSHIQVELCCLQTGSLSLSSVVGVGVLDLLVGMLGLLGWMKLTTGWIQARPVVCCQ